MENLAIKGTNRTPEVDFNVNGYIRLQGRSIPEDAGLFYNHLYSWIFRYCMNAQPHTNVHLNLEYMNSGSVKSILQILKELTILTQKEFQVVIHWYYETGDEDMLERGEYYESILNHKFIFIETS